MKTEQVTLDSLAARIDELESRIAIRDLASEYCHGFDKRDYQRFLSIWWEDCTWDIGPPFGRFETHSGIHTAIHEVLWPAWSRTHHLTTNQRISFSGPDHAGSVCDVDCTGMLVDQADCQIIGATYTDTLRRRNGVWKILQRSVQMHYFNPIPGAVLTAPGAQ